MAGLKQTYRLIRTLGKAEKRMLRMQSGLTAGEKDYLLLFDCMEKAVDENEAKAAFMKKRPHAVFAITCSYLYRNLISVLSYSAGQGTVDERIHEAIAEASILNRKGLTDDALALIRKHKSLARIKEKFLLHSLLARLELGYLSQLQFPGVGEKYLLDVQSDLKRSLYQELNVMEQSALYELLYLRYLQQGPVKNDKEKQQLNDLVMSEFMLADNPRYQSLEGEKIHSLFQSVYFMMSADARSGLRSFYELNTFFEKHPELWGDPPLHYISHLHGFINNLRAAGLHDEMLTFITKLKKLKTGISANDRFVEQNVFVFEMQYLIDRMQYRQAMQLVSSKEEEISRGLHLMHPSVRYATAFYAALACTVHGDVRKAGGYLKLLYTDRSLTHHFYFRLMRFLNLFHLSQLKDWSRLKHEMQAYKREYKVSVKIRCAENICFTFFRESAKAVQAKKQQDILAHAGLELDSLLPQTFEDPFMRYGKILLAVCG